MSLHRLEASGFKSIRAIDLTLGELSVLIGANGAGKSNLLGVFKLLNQIVERNLQVYVPTAGGADSLLHFGRKTTDRISIELSFGPNGYQCVLVPTAEDSLVFEQEICWYHQSEQATPKRVFLGRGHAETKLHDAPEDTKSLIPTFVLRHLQSWKLYHFHDTSENAKLKQHCSVDDNNHLRPDGANLAAVLYRLKKVKRRSYTNIVNAVRLAAPFFDDFQLEPSWLNPDKIRLEWKEKGTDTYFNASALSDGSLRFMSLATLLLQPVLPQTILLDEPELGLHPYAITLLAELLRGASKKTQVIVSTQSVTLVNQFEPEDMIVVERVGTESVFKRLDKTEMERWLDDFGLGDLWEKNVLGGRP